MAKHAQPSEKMLIADLHNYEQTINTESTSRAWVSKDPDAACKPLKFVWLQGNVVETHCTDTFTLDDGTGLALIGGCSKVPPVCPKPKQGGYFMVIGELKAIDNIPAIKAYKLQDLSREGTLLSHMWTLEVMDMRHFQNK